MSDEVVKKKIGELPQATELDRDSLLVIQQGAQALALLAGMLQDFCAQGVSAHEAAALAAQTAAEAAKAAAETAQAAAEGHAREALISQRTADNAAITAANNAVAIVERLLAGHVSDAQTAQAGAEAARDAAAVKADAAAGSAKEAAAIVKDAQSYVDLTAQNKNYVLEYSNNAFNSANRSENAAERAETAASRAIGDNVNWRATKTIVGEALDVIEATDVTFTNYFASIQLSETTLQAGVSYVVRWGDEEYICNCYEGDGVYYLGNGALIGESESNDEPFCISWYVSAANITATLWKETTTAETIRLWVYVDDASYEYSKLPFEHMPESVPYVILQSSTEGSTKRFKLTVDDTGTPNFTEVT